jgi:hypothetical protein
MQSRKATRLQNLQDGSPFIIEPLKDVFKIMYLIRGGDSTCKVQGYKKTETNGYSAFIDFFAPATEVFYDEGRNRLPILEGGGVSIPKEYLSEVNQEDKQSKKEETKKKKQVKALKINNNMTTEQVNGTKKGVGRPKKHKIDLPKNKEFTVNNLSAELGVKKFVINNELNRVKRENPDSIQIVGATPCGKGKPARVFKLI